METGHLYVVTCRCCSSTCKHVKLSLYRDSPRATVWIWYVVFFFYVAGGFMLIPILNWLNNRNANIWIPKKLDLGLT